MILYNPLYSKNVSTNVGQSFLKIIDEEFPAEHPPHKIFNRNTVKISYSCMPNIKQTIDGHNKSTLSTTSTTNSLDMCSCPRNNKVLCPLSNKCITESVIYIKLQSLLRTKLPIDLPKLTYVGLTENSFKTRLANHKASFNSFDKWNATELSKYVWELKNRNIHCAIKRKLY